MKKFVVTGILTLFLLAGYFTPVHAVGSQKVGFNYDNIHMIIGSVKGKNNNKFYKLNKGEVILKVEHTSSRGKNYLMTVELMRLRNGIDKSYGVQKINGTGTYKWNVDTNSDKYYIFAYGGKNNMHHYLSGEIRNK